MNCATLFFYGPLNDFLTRKRRGTVIEHSFDGQPSVKDMIESLGVPHPEIEFILVNGRGVDFNYLVQDHDQVLVYPVGMEPETLDVVSLRPLPPDPPRFVLDQHLGRLAAYLRMLGFDTLYRNDYHDEELAQVSSDEDRILLTRDVGLLKRGRVAHGYFVRQTNPKRQVAEIAGYYDLLTRIEPFRRCIKCNGHLVDVPKGEIDQALLPPNTTVYFEDFRRCPDCSQVYWRGAHVERMEGLIRDLHEESDLGA